ncbi:MAG: helix-turn-helix domain-containing protein [Clostridiales bacterium]|jgi:transcriptional regulator with XRE-family HTH domain|nr:helix-turn-helix domain-containing protein [Clostridiales bacterium]MCI2161966.1 helix-turn-helix domain-containing protein [Oscillospiraceae bacterium]MCI1962343.1 helix-turn-helix domain-containing protein [Clostridiales bacterium]MCI2022845.1 helix-turn-helix domain-containing protein [Clostridiales bacterium]MCI2027242.1 helix-turn-helix domain-containing protein [Clostridiales bacterium]
MDFNEKLQELRKRKGLTQEELAEALFVSRTAISKWESGRGYPSIDSLKGIASFFSVSIDELLSGEELVSIAQNDHVQEMLQMRDLVFGLLDCAMALFLFFPLFGQAENGKIHIVSLLSLISIPLYMKVTYFTLVSLTILCGLATLALQGRQVRFWNQFKSGFSLLLSVSGVLVFILSREPYAASLTFLFLLIKGILMLKR